MELKKVHLTGGILCLLSIFCSLTISFAEVPWKKYSYFQNWGGLNDQLSAIEIKDNEASDLQNVVFDTGGAIKKRFGYTAIPNNPVTKVATGAVVSITGLGYYQKNSGSKFIVAITNSDGKATAMKKSWTSGAATGAWDNIDAAILPSSYTDNNFCDFATAEDNLIITISATTQVKPFKYTGSGSVVNLTTDTDCPEATLVEYHKNHLFLAGDETYPSRVNFSAIDNITDYTATDFFDVQTSDGTKVRGMVSAYDSLYIFKEKSIWRLSGGERDSFTLQKMVEGTGTLSNNSISVVNNVIYFTTAQNDIAIYDGAYTVKFISQKIRQTIGGLNFTRATNNLGLAFSTYKYEDQDYYCSTTRAGSATNNKVLLFDTAYSAWTKFDGINANAWCVAQDSNGQNELIFGDYSGYVHSYPSNKYYDANVESDPILGFNEETSPIAAFYQTKWFRYGDLSLGDKYWRLLKTYALSETTNNTTLYAECRSDYEESGRIVEINLSESSSLWDVAIWDIDKWSGQSLKVGRDEIEKGTNMFQIKYSNEKVSEGFTIFGFENLIEPAERI